MAGRSWRDLQRSAAKEAPAATAAPARPSKADSGPDRGRLLEEAASGSPKLARLLAERRQLEERMHTLQSGGAELGPRDAARFQVPRFSERRVEEQALQRRRDADRESALRRRREQGLPAELSSADPRPPPRGRSLAEQVGTPPRSALDAGADPGQRDSLNGWLRRRDTERQQLREAARDRLAPLNRIGEAAGRAREGLGINRLDELDRRLAAEDSSYERGSIQRELGSQLGPADKVLGRVQKAASAPARAVERIDQAWIQRRDRIEGAMDRIGPYVDRRNRRLSVEEGGSGDLFARMEQNRQRGLARLRERREQDARDERRRERAQRRRREQEAET